MKMRNFHDIEKLLNISDQYSNFVVLGINRISETMYGKMNNMTEDVNREVEGGFKLLENTKKKNLEIAFKRQANMESSSLMFSLMAYLSKFYIEFKEPIQTIIENFKRDKELGPENYLKFINFVKQRELKSILKTEELINHDSWRTKTTQQFLRIKLNILKNNDVLVSFEKFPEKIFQISIEDQTNNFNIKSVNIILTAYDKSKFRSIYYDEGMSSLLLELRKFVFENKENN